jgi:molecular chaperone DnaK
VSAKDKATGKQQSIVIKASSGLNDEEIQRMVKDAEAHADEDRKFHEMVDARNQADNLIHAVNKSVKELGDKVDAAEKQAIDDAIKDLQEAMKGDSKDEIEEKTKTLAEKSGKLSERLYAQKAEEGQAAGGAEASDAGAKPAGDDVVDAEFEEVKDDK